MLSILIPVYNFDIRPLVIALHQQGEQLSVPFEIICVDDASPNRAVAASNAQLASLTAVQFLFLSQNKGRSKIRNYLATLAKYEYLIYMDCDSMPPDSNYLSRYLPYLSFDKLLYGGRIYTAQPPTDPSLLLHWYYGIHREQSRAKDRQNKCYDSFMTNNFLIPKSIFLEIQFDENLTQYGHEDTLFGIELKNRKIEIIHLDNPLIHIGLESNLVFLSKTQKAIENLYYLHLKYDLGNGIKLLNYYEWIDRWKLSFLVVLLYKVMAQKIEQNLCSAKPYLKLFDWWKLVALIQQKNKA